MTDIHTDSLRSERLKFHYRFCGDADGLPMVLLHGSFASSRWWEPFLNILPRAVQAFAPDLRGCGSTEKPEDGYTIPELSDDVWSFTQALRLEDFDLVGHSSGGAIATEFALHHPDVVRTLTLVDSAPVEGVFTPAEALRVLDQMRTDKELLRRALRILMPTLDMAGTTGTVENSKFFDALLDDATQMAPAAFSGVASALGQWNRFAEAKNLTLPTLVVWGELDQIVSREAASRTLVAIPGASNLEMLKNVGHSPMIESPVVLAERIIDFIADDHADYDEIRGLVDNGDDNTG